MEKDLAVFHKTKYPLAIKLGSIFLRATLRECWPDDIHSLLLIAAPKQHNNPLTRDGKLVPASWEISDTLVNMIAATTQLMTGGSEETRYEKVNTV